MFATVREAEMFWLNATNIVLGLVVAICVAAMAVSIVRAVLERRRKLSGAFKEIDQDMRRLAGDSHAFDVPGLGLTMADGGEPAGKPGKRVR